MSAHDRRTSACTTSERLRFAWMQSLWRCLQQQPQQQQRQLLILLLVALALFLPLCTSFQPFAKRSSLAHSRLYCPYTPARPPHPAAPPPAPLLLQRGLPSSRHAWFPALTISFPKASVVCSAAAAAAAAAGAAVGEEGGASSSSSSKCLSLPLWSRVFSRRFLFSDSLPSALSPLHAALFAEATRASRVVGFWGLCDLLRPAHAQGRTAAAAAASAAAGLAAFASWRLLSLAARVFRNVTARHRLAENRIYGPLHSLDATIRPLEAESRTKRQAHKRDPANPPTSSSSSGSSSNSASSSGGSKKHPLQDEEDSSTKARAAPRATARGPGVSSTDSSSSSSCSRQTDSSSSSSRRKKKRGVYAPAEAAAKVRERAPGRKRRRGAHARQGALAAAAVAAAAAAGDAVDEGLVESAGQLPPEAA